MPHVARCEPSSGGAGVLPEAQAAIDGLEVHAKLLSADAHNAGFYVNAYTTKLNPGMSTVIQRLIEGVRRLHADCEASQGHQTADSTAADARGPPGAFKKTMQMPSRFDTPFRRASWKSGAEMVFPPLIGHMPVNARRCVCVCVCAHAQGLLARSPVMADALWPGSLQPHAFGASGSHYVWRGPRHARWLVCRGARR